MPSLQKCPLIDSSTIGINYGPFLSDLGTKHPDTKKICQIVILTSGSSRNSTTSNHHFSLKIIFVAERKTEVTGLKIIAFKCIKKGNSQLQLPAPPVGSERLHLPLASCQDGWLEKMTVISPACQLLTEPLEACCFKVLLLLNKDLRIHTQYSSTCHVYHMPELRKTMHI